MLEDAGKNTKYYINSVIGILFMFGFGFLPPIEPLTALGMKYIGILLGLIYLWSTVELLWPSILGLAAIVVTGTMSGTAITSKAFGGDTIILCILSLAVIYSITNTGAFDYVINWFFKRKIFIGRPWVLSTTLLAVMYVVSILNGGFAMLFLLWEVVYKIADQVNISRKSMWCAAMATGMVLAYVYGAAVLPFMPTYLFIMGLFQSMTGMVSIPMMNALVMNLIIGVATIGLYIVLIRFVLRVNVDALKNAKMEDLLIPLPPMSKRQKFAAIYLIVFVLALIVPGSVSTLMAGTAIASFFGNLGTIGMCFIMFALLCIIKVNGKPILVFREVAAQVQWEAVSLMAVVFAFATMLTAEGTGTAEFIMMLINPIVGGMGAYTFTLFVFIFTIIFTNVANNNVVMVLMITLINVYMPTLNFFLPTMAFLMLYMSQTAFMLPSASIYGALLHSQATIIEKKYIYLCATMTVISAIIMMIVIAIPLTPIIF